MTISSDKTRVYITIPKPLAEQLRKQAAKSGETVSDIIVKKLVPGEPAKEDLNMKELNKICDCGAELAFDSNIDGHEREYLQSSGEYLYKTVCPNCGKHWQFRESDLD